MRKHRNPLAAYFYSELCRLADGEKSGPVSFIEAPATAPCLTRPGLWGGIERARPVQCTMAPPPCLMSPDTAMGQQRRFNHARELLTKLVRS